MNDYSVFTRGLGSATVILAVYVDDIILTGTDLEEITALKSFLHDAFKIKDLGLLHYFLGIEVLYSDHGVLLHQRKFIHDLLRDFNCSDYSSVVSPLELYENLRCCTSDLLPKPEEYWQLLSQFMQQPCLPHVKVALHLLRNLKGTSTFGLFISSSPNLYLSAYCDSYWGACPDSRRSVSYFSIFLSDSLIRWKTKKQPVESLSSNEAEYRSMSKAVAEITWVVHLLDDFGVSTASPVPLFCDNQASLHIAKNLVFHEHTKHIELDCHFVRAKLAEGLIGLSHTSSATQLDDLVTKVLSGADHHLHLRKLGVRGERDYISLVDDVTNEKAMVPTYRRIFPSIYNIQLVQIDLQFATTKLQLASANCISHFMNKWYKLCKLIYNLLQLSCS
ncbi:uncharacterized mitochondrial protein AtMg00810-like [Lycium barbarum]|uniref:uncharacterized mitochondrial protein AtMg00810-like n=1 Tax=Lycium barbarum TaxID=112863 RepID=UPI00293E4DDE|nr:uncharacterized mitochondrial protein AtMg00810-like [Lycium barbarum]